MSKLSKVILIMTIIGSLNINGFTQSLPQLGEQAPDIVITNIEGINIQLSSLRGKVVLIDFWASWCGPCRMANEETVEVYHEFKEKGFEIFSVSLDRKKEPWIRAIKDDALPWPYHGCDFKEWNSESCLKYKVEALPTTYLIDEYGQIVSTDVDYFDLKKILKKHFNKIVFFPRESANKLILSSESKYEVQKVDGTYIFKGISNQIDISTLPEGDYMLKIDGREEHFKKISSNVSEIKYSIENHIAKFEKPSNIKVFTKRGVMMFEKDNIQELSKVEYLNGDYYLWINGLVYHLGI